MKKKQLNRSRDCFTCSTYPDWKCIDGKKRYNRCFEKWWFGADAGKRYWFTMTEIVLQFLVFFALGIWAALMWGLVK